MRVSPAILDAESRRWRTGLLVTCTVLAVGVVLNAFEGTPIMPWFSTTMGLSPEYTPRAAGAVVMNVAKDGPADLAGLRVGDRIDFSDIAFRERWRLRDDIKGWGGPAGERLRYVAHRNTNIIVAVVSPRRVTPSWPTWSVWIAIIGSLWGLLFAGILAIRRPDLVEARLLSITLLAFFGVNPLTGIYAPWPIVEFIIHTLSGAIWVSVPAVCLTILASRAARPLSLTRRVLAGLAIGVAVASAGVDVAWYVGWFLLALPVYWAFADPLNTLSFFASLLCAIAAVLASRGAERARLLWIIASVSPVWLYYIFVDFLLFFNPQPYFSFSSSSYLNILFTLAYVSLPIAVTYAVLSRRILDIGYLLNQAAVFSGVSVIVVGLFMLGEWVLGSWFGRFSHMTNVGISAALAIGLGFSVRAIHTRVDRVLDRVFFRKRHEDETAIRSFAEEASGATDAAVLMRRTKETLETHADVAFVTLVMRDGAGRYGDASESDPAIAALQDRHNALDLATLSTQLRGEFAYPMIARGQLVGALVLGPKCSGESYAPDESRAIMQLAREVGAALHNLALAKVLREHHLQE